MNSSICIWGGKDLTTQVGMEPDVHSVFFFNGDDKSDYARIFMSPAQLLALRDQINEIAEALTAEAQAEGVSA